MSTPISGPSGRRTEKAFSTPSAATDPLPYSAPGVHREKDTPESCREPGGELTILTHLDVLVEVASCLCELLELVQQDRLADTAKSGKHQTAAVPPGTKALQCDVHRLDLTVSSDERRRASSGTRAVRVAYWVHGTKYSVFFHL